MLVGGANGIIAGHGHVLAARNLGLAEVPEIELASLTEAQRRTCVLADNKPAARGGTVAGWPLHDRAVPGARFAARLGDGTKARLGGHVYR